MIKIKKSKFKICHKVRDQCHYTGKFGGDAHNICNLRHKVPKKISVVFHNGSTYDYHFIIKQLAEDFKGQFEYLGENILQKNILLFQYQSKKIIIVKKSYTN